MSAADRAVLPAEVMLRRRQQGGKPRSPERQELTMIADPQVDLVPANRALSLEPRGGSALRRA